MTHHCHWPDCEEIVSPALWGCRRHWYMLPKHLRNKIWAAYRPGQEISKTPSNLYIDTAHEVQVWIQTNFGDKQMTSESGFDPSVFLGATLTEANTRRPPVPGGSVLKGVLGEPKFRQVEGKQEKNLGVIYTFLEVPIKFDLTQTPGLADQIGQNEVSLQWSTGVDLLPNGQGFDMAKGKNNGLRILREALDLNVPGQPFNIMMIVGRSVLCTIKNDPYLDTVQDKVGSIAKIS